jgi:hypothetical protein
MAKKNKEVMTPLNKEHLYDKQMNLFNELIKKWVPKKEKKNESETKKTTTKTA